LKTCLKVITAVIFCVFIKSVEAQKILAFDKSGKVKRIRYYVGDPITLKLKNGRKFSGQIKNILENSFIVGQKEVFLDSVLAIHTYKQGSILDLVSRFCYAGGIAYIPLTSFNRLINNDSPIVTRQAINLTAGFWASSFLFRELIHRRYKISEKRPLKIIDISI